MNQSPAHASSIQAQETAPQARQAKAPSRLATSGILRPKERNQILCDKVGPFRTQQKEREKEGRKEGGREGRRKEGKARKGKAKEGGQREKLWEAACTQNGQPRVDHRLSQESSFAPRRGRCPRLPKEGPRLRLLTRPVTSPGTRSKVPPGTFPPQGCRRSQRERADQ